MYVLWHGSNPLASSIETLQPIAGAGLSRRELGVLEAVLDVGAVAAVASALNISPHTVLNHLRAIRRKLGVHTMADLFRLLLQSSVVAREGAAQS